MGWKKGWKKGDARQDKSWGLAYRNRGQLGAPLNKTVACRTLGIRFLHHNLTAAILEGRKEEEGGFRGGRDMFYKRMLAAWTITTWCTFVHIWTGCIQGGLENLSNRSEHIAKAG